MDKYQQEMRLQEDVKPLDLWMSNEHKYPILSAFTQYLFVIPASSAPIEREFSVSGYISCSRRFRLNDKNLEREVWVKENKKYL